ncbi:MAG: hypothetical protein AAFQ20_03610 [Bacteroidota bacterium]
MGKQLFGFANVVIPYLFVEMKYLNPQIAALVKAKQKKSLVHKTVSCGFLQELPNETNSEPKDSTSPGKD